MNAPSNRPRVPGRRGFTLVELMVVIVIIGVLIALLLPAINGAVRTARTNAASTEVNQLGQALAQFKTQYGVYPPSSIILSETGNYSAAYLNVSQAVASRSASFLRRIWPKMVLSTTGTLSTSQIPGGFYDFNGDSVLPTITGGVLVSGQIHVLDGAECLVFFLGGQPGGFGATNVTDGSLTTLGFTKNPANPVISPLVPAAAPSPTASNPLALNRSTPLFEFRPGRLNDMYPVVGVGGNPGNYFPEYSDNLSSSSTPSPFVYFSAYEGAGYQPDDANYPEMGEDVNGNPIGPIGSLFYNAPNGSPAPNPYTNGAPILSTGMVNPQYINKNTYQIVSAGIDGLFGPGGGYKASTANPLADVVGLWSYAATPPGPIPSTSMRLREKDNVTNFKGGRLD